MKWLVTGSSGLLGTELTGTHIVSASKNDLDIRDSEAVNDAVRGCAVVINSAAWTDVDDAEDNENQAFSVNSQGARNLAEACRKHGTILIHVSTGAVLTDSPLEQAETAAIAPINAYARSKASGELAILRTLPTTGFVVRTSWLYGSHGRNFVSTMIDLAKQRDHLSVVADQWGQPTWAKDLAQRIIQLGHAALTNRASAGVYHGVSSGRATWFDLARESLALAGLDPDIVRPVTMTAYPRKSPQLKHNLLSQHRWLDAGFSPIDDWKTMLRSAFSGKNSL